MTELITKGISERLHLVQHAWDAYKTGGQTWCEPVQGIVCAPLGLFASTLNRALLVAKTNQTMVIDGPTGVGKSELAHAIHQRSQRSGPFRQISSADLASNDVTLIRGRLAGYGRHHGLPGIPRAGEKGILQETGQGTLLIDEVADLSEAAQHYLLLVLDGKPLPYAVGIGPELTPDVRFIFATNQDLAAKVRNHTFRQDLYERIKMHKITLPPLAGRYADIAALIRYFSSRFGDRVRYAEDLFKAMVWYSWPGNVRELKFFIQATQEHDAALSFNLESLSATTVNDEVVQGLRDAYALYQQAALSSRLGEREERVIEALVRLAVDLFPKVLGPQRQNLAWDWRQVVVDYLQNFKKILATEMGFPQATVSKGDNCLNILLDCYGQSSQVKSLFARVFSRLRDMRITLSCALEKPRYITLESFVGLSAHQLRYLARRRK